MKHFEPWEFQGFYFLLSPLLMTRLDALREEWEQAIHISKAPGAVGRHLGEHVTTYHNVDRYGRVMAVDTMPDGLECVQDAYRFFALATKCGFTGIGFYPEWEPQAGFHLDVRPTQLATWAKLDGVYTSIQRGFDAVT